MKSHDEQRIETAVKLLAACHSRTLPVAASERWVRKLAPFGQKSALYRVLEEACDRPKMPACSEIVSEVLEEISREHARDGGTWKSDIPAPLTPDQRARADAAAVKSMLWLHYAKGWKLEDFSSGDGNQRSLLGRLFGRDPVAALKHAMTQPHHDKDSILAWMDMQIEMGR